MGDNTNRWTDAEMEIVRRMHAEGRSATEISKALSGRSRNSVIGIIHRQKMNTPGTRAAQRVVHVQRQKATAKPPKAERQPLSDAARWAKAGRASILAQTQIARRPVSVKPVLSVVAAPSAEEVHAVIGALADVLAAPSEAREPVSLLALEAGMCRNPVRDGPDGPLFCGARVEDRRRASYCPSCATRLLQPQSALRPVKVLSEPAPRKRVALGAIRYGAEAMDVPDYAHNRLAVLNSLKGQLTEVTVGVFDLGGMDEVIRAFDAARAELARRRAEALSRTGWIV